MSQVMKGVIVANLTLFIQSTCLPQTGHGRTLAMMLVKQERYLKL